MSLYSDAALLDTNVYVVRWACSAGSRVWLFARLPGVRGDHQADLLVLRSSRSTANFGTGLGAETSRSMVLRPVSGNSTALHAWPAAQVKSQSVMSNDSWDP